MSGHLSIEELLDREAIRDCIYRYCWATDRSDEELFGTIYWPEALDERGGAFKGTGAEAIKWILAQVAKFDRTEHLIGNIVIRIEGNRARTESYYRAYQRVLPEGGVTRENFVGGRYLDRWEKRNGEWRIIHRHGLMDWYRSFEQSEGADKGYVARTGGRGRRKPDDPVYSLFSDGVLKPLKIMS